MVEISQTLFYQMQALAERGPERGGIPHNMAALATFAVIGSRSVANMMEGYYGAKAVDKAYDLAKEEQAHLDLAEEVVADIRGLRETMQATHTTSDFPLALANLRTRRVREAFEGVDSGWRNWASVITVPDFKTIRTLRFTELPELKLRPEATDVQYATLEESEDGYRVANHELGMKYTWEMWENDEVGKFAAAWRSFGRGARRTEGQVVFRAVRDGLPRTVIPSGAGIPTIARLEEMELILSQRAFTPTEGEPVPYGYAITDVIHGTPERVAINTVLNQQFTDFYGGAANSMLNRFTPHWEREWQRALGRDIVAFDNAAEWLEVAFMEGFENGPKTYVKLPDVQDHVDEGDFEDHTLKIKMGHTLGAKVVDPDAAIRVQGAA